MASFFLLTVGILLIVAGVVMLRKAKRRTPGNYIWMGHGQDPFKN